MWHLDGYDKLKPYEFTIHGCIDGLVALPIVIVDNNRIRCYSYSRRVIWLHLASTNNDPRVILFHYLLAVLKCKGLPIYDYCVVYVQVKLLNDHKHF